MKRNPKVYNKFKTEHCEVCMVHESQRQLCIDHVKTFGSGGKDVSGNCMTLCMECHTEKGKIGTSGMVDKYPQYKQWLISHGWIQRELDEKWVLDGVCS
jgi:5-methylcytosine-specific restriction endonuclease McrA